MSVHQGKTVGVLGGLGPKATVYFADMVVDLTKASCDQDHVDMIICNRATTPDRTGYIIDNSNENPANILAQDAAKLQEFGADFLVMTCNTAHYFYEDICNNISIPFINIVEETVLYAKNNNYKKLGILATTGNINTNLYQNMCNKHGVDFMILDSDMQNDVMSIIYDDIKSGKCADMNKFNSIIQHLKSNNCDGVVLGCTELSILKNDNNLTDPFFIDSLEVLARKTILLANKEVI